MSPLTPRQQSRKRDLRREQIKRAALVVFARHGVARAKISEIATEADVSHGLFYRYFDSKAALYAALIEELMAEAVVAIENLHLLPGSPAEQLQVLTADMLDEKNRLSFQLIIKARRDDTLPKRVKRLLDEASPDAFVERLVPILERGQKRGELVKGEPRQLLHWYFTVINSLLFQAPHPGQHGMPSAAVLMRMLARNR